MIPLNIITWCGEQVQRQGDGPQDVAPMCNAWDYLNNKTPTEKLTVRDILVVGQYTKPSINTQGFRRSPVTFTNNNVGADWRSIDRLVSQLLDLQAQMTPQEFFYEFETIHPFADGNGRTGQLIANFHNSSMRFPVTFTFTKPVSRYA